MKQSVNNRERPAILLIFCGFLLAVLMSASGCSYTVDDLHEVRHANAAHEIAVIRNSSAPFDRPLTLREAVEYALKHNLEARMADMETAVQREAATGEKLSMLPRLLVNSDYSSKDKDVASTSVNPDTGVETLSPSISTERNVFKTNVDLAWNLIDFGVSYFRARQAVNRLVIMEQRVRRVRQKLVLEVTTAYGKALASREAAHMAEELLTRFSERRDVVQGQVAANLVPRSEGLKSEIRCSETLVRLAEYDGRYKEAKAALAKLMGLGPGAQFELADMDFSVTPPAMDIDVRSMEEEALRSRPELYEKDMEERISADEAWIAVINMFPRPELFLRFDYDTNKYLSTSNWYTVGVRAAWNVLELPRHMSNKRKAELREEYVRKERLALSVGVLAQLHIALVKYHNAVIRCRLRGELNRKRSELVEELELQRRAGEGNVEEMFTEMGQYFFTRNAYIESCMEVLSASELIRATLGRDPEKRTFGFPQQTAALHDNGPIFERGLIPALDSPSTMLAVDRVHEILTDEELPLHQPSVGTGGSLQGTGLDQRTHRPVPAGPEPYSRGTSSSAPMDSYRHSSSGSGPAVSSADTIPQPSSGIASSSIAHSPAFETPTAGSTPTVAAAPATPKALPAGAHKGISVKFDDTPQFRGITVTAAGTIPAYDFFNMDKPARVVVDVAGKWAYTGPSTIRVNKGGVSSVRVGEHKDKLRLVFELTGTEGMEPAFEERDNALIIDF